MNRGSLSNEKMWNVHFINIVFGFGVLTRYHVYVFAISCINHLIHLASKMKTLVLYLERVEQTIKIRANSSPAEIVLFISDASVLRVYSSVVFGWLISQHDSMDSIHCSPRLRKIIVSNIPRRVIIELPGIPLKRHLSRVSASDIEQKRCVHELLRFGSILYVLFRCKEQTRCIF